jgi:hypothetical protein
MAIGRSVDDILQLLGHDGSDRQWPDLSEPLCRRSFHIQELVKLAWNLGYAMTPIEAYSRMTPLSLQRPLFIDNSVFFDEIVSTTRGVITGHTTIGHATAYDHGLICDPRGMTYRLQDNTDFSAESVWILTERGSDVQR